MQDKLHNQWSRLFFAFVSDLRLAFDHHYHKDLDECPSVISENCKRHLEGIYTLTKKTLRQLIRALLALLRAKISHLIMKARVPSEFEEPVVTSKMAPLGRQPTRRETILSLVEMLLQENGSNAPGDSQLPFFEEDKDVPTVDEHMQTVGAGAFYKLQRQINNLDKELRNFANAARQLGSSVAILSSTFHLRDRLAQLLFLYHENAANIFPKKIVHIAREICSQSPTATRRRRGFRRIKGKAEFHIPRPTVAENLDPETFPEQFELLGKEVTTFLKCLNEFPEFTDEAVNSSILSFEGDLKYWASCLKEYTGQFRYPAVQRYIHDLSQEMGEHIDELTSSLSMFIEVGVPTIRFAQKHGANNLLNLSTVATFFSAVTATTMQASFGLDRTSVADTVNCFWFASLVFSIGAAVNSLLGLTWKQAMYRSPGHRVPWWVLIWIKRSPLVFLVLSIACFSIGLCCFAHASHQAFVTSTITTVLTTFTSFGLAAVSAWFASERWIFSRHRGQKWLSDVLIEAKDRFWLLPGITWAQRGSLIAMRHLNTIFKATLRVSGVLSLSTCRRTELVDDDDLEAHGLPTGRPQMYDPTKRRTSETIAVMSEPSTPTSPFVPPTPLNSPVDQDILYSYAAATNTDRTTSVGKQLWMKAFRNVKMLNVPTPTQQITTVPVIDPPPSRQRTASSSLNFSDKKKVSTSESVPFSRPRISALVPQLMEMEITHDLAAHSALVRHMQFSPDGQFLATSSWDKTSVIFRVGHSFTCHHTLAHTQGFVGQVEWSPSGKILLTKMARGIKVWSAENGVCKKTIDRNIPIETVTWFPTGDAFLSIEESTATKLNLNGNVLDMYHFGNMKLQNIAITPDSQRLVGIGPLLRSPTGLQPSKARVEKRIVVYNIETKQIENQTPVLNDVRDVTLAQTIRNGLVALISYEHMTAPQLWKLELVKDRDDNTVVTARLSLRHTYLPKMWVDFAGPSCFGGKNNELVLCAGKGGDIHIWDQESGALLHIVRIQQAHGGDLTCIAWNNAVEDPFMFATGSHDGGVRVWTRQPDQVLECEPTPTKNIHECPRTSSPFQMNSNMSSTSINND